MYEWSTIHEEYLSKLLFWVLQNFIIFNKTIDILQEVWGIKKNLNTFYKEYKQDRFYMNENDNTIEVKNI